MKRVFVIAEAGVNHNGDMDIAKGLIDVAADAGADAVKFQTFRAERLVTRSAARASYQERNTGVEESQFEMLRRLELDEAAHRELMFRCEKRGLIFLSTPFDLDSIELLDRLGLAVLKIASGEITNLPYLRKIGALGKKLILSTGMSTLTEIGAALRILSDAGTSSENITVLHATTEYPTPMHEVNLLAMKTIAEAFNVAVGYSDHTRGIEVAVAAVAMGARVLEKHFTLDCSMAGPDHAASLEPGELRAMINAIRNIEKALGDGCKAPGDSEQKNIPLVRKSIVARKFIGKGELLSEDNLTVKRPAGGISPMRWDEVLGTVANKDYQVDEPL